MCRGCAIRSNRLYTHARTRTHTHTHAHTHTRTHTHSEQSYNRMMGTCLTAKTPKRQNFVKSSCLQCFGLFGVVLTTQHNTTERQGRLWNAARPREIFDVIIGSVRGSLSRVSNWPVFQRHRGLGRPASCRLVSARQRRDHT